MGTDSKEIQMQNTCADCGEHVDQHIGRYLECPNGSGYEFESDASKVTGACESGWTGDRCTFPLFHDGQHSND
jgi:hypothetical protein